MNRGSSASVLSPKDFLMEINPEVQNAVSDALEAAQRGQFQHAMTTLTDLLHDHPLHHDVAYGIGVVHIIKGEHEAAITWFDRAIKIYPYSIESHFNKAVAFQKLLDVPNCIRSYQQVVAIGPADDPEVVKASSIIRNMASAIMETDGVDLDAFLRSADKFNEAFDLMDRADWRGALDGFRSSAALNDDNAPCHGNIGLCLAQLGHKREALASLDRALEIDPEYQPALSNRKVLEKMTEGKPLENTTYQSINTSLRTFLKKRA